MNNLEYEKAYWKQGYKFIAGVDEAGRGPIAGPLVVAAVILPKNFYHPKINDSKKINAKMRQELYQIIIENALSYSIVIKDNKIIDQINIYQSTKIAMIEAVSELDIKPDFILIDAMKLEEFSNSLSIIKGDQKSFTIAASSILAKVTRDKIMENFQIEYPNFSFSKHKGYPTKSHYQELKKYGITSIHRLSFEPVKSILETLKIKI